LATGNQPLIIGSLMSCALMRFSETRLQRSCCCWWN